MPYASRVLFPLLLASALFGSVLHAAPLDPAAARAELKAIDKLSETSTTEALARLLALRAAGGTDLPYDLRQDLLRAEV